MSNSYPVWWDSVLTVYNRYEDPQTNLVTWYRTVLSGCFWKYAGSKVSINQVALDTDNVVCRIPKNEAFLTKDKWIAIPADKKANYFTLGKGDIIVYGEVTDTISEYEDGKRSSDLLAKYSELQGCMEMQRIAINTGVGRCEEHYYVSGI